MGFFCFCFFLSHIQCENVVVINDDSDNDYFVMTINLINERQKIKYIMELVKRTNHENSINKKNNHSNRK